MRTIRMLVYAISGCLLMLLTCVTVCAQAGATTCNISGNITDQQQAAIGGATVQAVNVATGQIREVISEEDGTFIIAQLTPGRYRLEAAAEGFMPRIFSLNLVLGVTAHATIQLKVNEKINITVDVEDKIDISKTENSVNLTPQAITQLPINRRNFIDFSLTTPGVVRALTKDGIAGTSGFSVNGISPRSNNVTVDGLDNNDYGSGSIRSLFSQDAVSEFQILSSNFSAEFGRALGAVINTITRSGNNDVHGNLFLFNRNDKISARDAFASFKPPFTQYQFGSTVSGPIKKNRLFFFGSAERLSVNSSNIVTISDESVRAARRQGFDLSNGPVAFAVGNTSVLTRFDAIINNRDTLWVKYNFGGGYNGGFEKFGGLTAATSSSIQRLKDNSLSLSNTFINSQGSIINETRFLYSRRDQLVLPLDNGPQISIVAPEGLITFGRRIFTPNPRLENIYQLANNVSLLYGSQLIKFGIDFDYTRLPEGRTSLPILAGGFANFTQLDFSALTGIPGLPVLTGLQSFDPTLRTPQQRSFLMLFSQLLPSFVKGFPKGVPLADLPLPLFFSQSFGNPKVSVNTKLFSAFVQDEIKLKENLLLKAGLRYDLARVQFNPSNNGNVSPRLAVAYNPTANINLHAAYGIFFGVPLFGQTFSAQVTGKGAQQLPVIPLPFSALIYNMPGHQFPESEQTPPGIFTPQLSFEFSLDPRLRNSYTHQINSGIDYNIRGVKLSAGYNFVRGIKLVAGRQINPVVRPVANDPVQSRITGRIDPTRGDIIEFESAFDSYYHSFTLAAEKEVTNRLRVTAYYTLSKSIDNLFDILNDLTDGSNNSQRPGDERGLSLQDVRNRLVFSGSFDSSGIKNRLLNSWQVASIITVESGRPYNLLAGVDLNRDGDNPPFDRPLGMGRNTGVMPGFFNCDVRIARKISIKDRWQIQGLIELFNVFNKVNISEIDRTFTPDKNGVFHLPKQNNSRYTAPSDRFRNAFSSRQLQFGIRINF